MNGELKALGDEPECITCVWGECELHTAPQPPAQEQGEQVWRYRFRDSESGGWHDWRYSESEPALTAITIGKTEVQGPFTRAAGAEDARDGARYRFIRDVPWEGTPLARVIHGQRNAYWDSSIDNAMAIASQAQEGANG